MSRLTGIEEDELEDALKDMEYGEWRRENIPRLAAYIRKQLAEDAAADEHHRARCEGEVPRYGPSPKRTTGAFDREGLILAARILGGFRP